MDISQKTKNRTVIGSSSPTPWCVSKEMRSMIKGHAHACYTAGLCTTVRRNNQKRVNHRMDKENMTRHIMWLTKGKK